jgi:UTP-glucose-1-phosphate uridylyltransferase
MDDKLSCVAQMIETHKLYQTNVLGLKTTAIEDVNRFGAIAGVLHRDDPDDDGEMLSFKKLVRITPQAPACFHP